MQELMDQNHRPPHLTGITHREVAIVACDLVEDTRGHTAGAFLQIFVIYQDSKTMYLNHTEPSSYTAYPAEGQAVACVRACFRTVWPCNIDEI